MQWISLALSLGLLAQAAEPSVVAAANPPAEAPAAPRSVHLTKGTDVEIELVDALSSKTSRLGENFAIRLVTPISQNGAVVVAAGALGHGEVIDASRAGMNGKQGKLIVSARELNLNGVKTKVRGMTVTITGANRVNTVISMMAVPYLGLASALVRGGDIELPAGTKATVHLAEDIDLPLLAADANPNGGTVQ